MFSFISLEILQFNTYKLWRALPLVIGAYKSNCVCICAWWRMLQHDYEKLHVIINCISSVPLSTFPITNQTKDMQWPTDQVWNAKINSVVIALWHNYYYYIINLLAECLPSTIMANGSFTHYSLKFIFANYIPNHIWLAWSYSYFRLHKATTDWCCCCQSLFLNAGTHPYFLTPVPMPIVKSYQPDFMAILSQNYTEKLCKKINSNKKK
jgi:hypothetical protein